MNRRASTPHPLPRALRPRSIRAPLHREYPTMKTEEPNAYPAHLTRRDLLLATAGVAALGRSGLARAAASPTAAAGAATPPAMPAPKAPSGPFSLPPLPYADNALDPVISANTLGIHHGKHHQAYVDNLNKAVAGTPFADMTLEAIIAATYGVAERTAIYNNAAQHWNHSFYWRSLKAQGGGEPPAALKLRIEAAFGSVDGCRKELLTAATTPFGSGWTLLLPDGGKLPGTKTGNPDPPPHRGRQPPPD